MYQIRQNYVFFIEKGFLIFPTYYSLRAIYYVFQINYFQMLKRVKMIAEQTYFVHKIK